MKIEVKKAEGLRRELRFEIPKDRVSKVMEDIYQDIGKVAKIKGFRPGKAPRHLLEQHHGKLAKEETLKKLIPEAYREGIAKEKLEPLDLPEIEDISFQDGLISFTARLDVKPEIPVKNYKGIVITRKDSQVTEEEVQRTLEFFQKGQGSGKEITLDDAFAHGLGYPSLEEFKKSLRRRMEIDKDRQNRLDVENQIIDELLRQMNFGVPASLVSRQLERRVLETLEHWQAHHKLTDEELSKKELELRKDLQPIVEKDVRIYLIFDKIAQLENISVEEGGNLPAKVMEFLLKEAKWEAK